MKNLGRNLAEVLVGGNAQGRLAGVFDSGHDERHLAEEFDSAGERSRPNLRVEPLLEVEEEQEDSKEVLSAPPVPT